PVTAVPSPGSSSSALSFSSENVTNLAIFLATLLICICGLAGNGIVLRLLRSCSMRRNPITVYIFYQASTDFNFLLIFLFNLRHMTQDTICSPLLAEGVLTVILSESLFYYNMGLCLLTAISIERCRSILCPLWCRCHCPQHLSKVVDALLSAIYVAFIVTVNPICLFLKQKYEDFQVALISMYTLNLLLFASCMVISSTILFTKVKRGSQQQPFKRLDIVIFLSVLFALPLSCSNLMQQLSYTPVSNQMVFLLACLHSTIKPFIYFSMGRCSRPCSVGSLQLCLRKVFEEPEENTASSNDGTMDMVV
uniref:G-protein coupled receptors family 1 profile domain-containing protein n=1 Tax=Malurus cyaneus samueli TaxID=2593467 RepID=A0A8C5TRK8_9PASS